MAEYIFTPFVPPDENTLSIIPFPVHLRLSPPCKRWGGREAILHGLPKDGRLEAWKDEDGTLHLSPAEGERLWMGYDILAGHGPARSRIEVYDNLVRFHLILSPIHDSHSWIGERPVHLLHGDVQRSSK